LAAWSDLGVVGRDGRATGRAVLRADAPQGGPLMHTGNNATRTMQTVPGRWRQQKQWRARRRAFWLGIAVLICFLPLTWTTLSSFGLRLDDTASPPTLTGTPTLENYGEIGVKEPSFWGEVVTSAA